MNIVEVQMPYEERTGRSKLRIGRDGWRFLRVIVDSALLYRPSRPLSLAGLFCSLVAISLMLLPTEYYLRHRAVTEWMIYRFVVSHLVGTSACLLLCASYLAGRTVRIALSTEASTPDQRTQAERFFASRAFWLLPTLLTLAGVALVIPSFIELVKTGATYEHWSRFIAMSFLCSSALTLIVTRALDYVLQLVAVRLAYLQAEAAVSSVVQQRGYSESDALRSQRTL